ncbi:MAG: carbohydrate ABC transporter permease [Clostridia bacterium]|nr:carbohydrate ABC transporter permease [Clostridia bacterium]MBR5767830.1 carbohydrate ABC transporter permease [Clostridia bacterium]
MARKLRISNHRVVLNRSKGGDTAIFIILFLLGIVMFLPLWYLIITALKPLGERNITPPLLYVMKPTPQNFIDLFSNMNSTWVPVSRYFFNTIIISVGGTFGCLVLGSLTAYALSKIRFPGANFLFNMIRYSLMISSTIAGITNFFIFVWLGWLNTYWISIVPVWGSTLGLYLMKQFIDSNVSDEMIEAARIDGASELRIYWQIVMPLVKPAWLTLLVTTFQSTWNGGASGYVWSEQLKTFNVAISNISTVSVGASSAGSVVMMSVPIIFFVVNQAKIVETMGSSGMKD